MPRPMLLIVHGPPGAGKTTLGRQIARELDLPFISKDDVKDILFDILGWQDREWSQKLGHASSQVMFHWMECELRVGRSAVVETAFHPRFHNERFLEFKEHYGVELVQVYCTADERVLFERFNRRATSGERHPGHVDHLASYERFAEELRQGNNRVLEIGGTLIEVDTTDFSDRDCERVLSMLRWVKGWIGRT